jgi:hypothetical protein
VEVDVTDDDDNVGAFGCIFWIGPETITMGLSDPTTTDTPSSSRMRLRFSGTLSVVPLVSICVILLPWMM